MVTRTPISLRNRHSGSTCCNLTFRYCVYIIRSETPQTCITKHVLVTLSICCVSLFLKYIFFLFYYPTLSLLCMLQSYNDNRFCRLTSSCFFYMTEHNYSVFCNQKQGSTKTVNASLPGNFFLARFARSVFKTLMKCIVQSGTSTNPDTT